MRDSSPVVASGYRIVPRRRGYQVEAVNPDGTSSVLETWPTEEAAVSHLRDLQRRAEVKEARAFGILPSRPGPR
jgi:hypothetical protein